MKLSLIDTHCDTILGLYTKGQSIKQNDCHIDLKKAEKYSSYAQFFAVWPPPELSDGEGYDQFLLEIDNFKKEIDQNSDKIALVSTFDEMNDALSKGKRAAFLAVEDARLLEGKLERMDVLRDMKVKYLTLMWGGVTCIGSSHDAVGGLTEFGREVLKKCFEYGIVPDISHANEEVSDEITDMALSLNKPIIASHSNSYSVYPHTRNLRKKHLDAIIKLGGTVGISLCPYHLKDMEDGKPCTAEDIFRHIDNYMSLGAQDTLGLGCDLDGTYLPEGFSGVCDLERIAEVCLAHGYTEETVNNIFFKNNYEFIKRNFT